MRGKERVGIEMMMALDQGAPDDGKQDRSDDELRKVAQRRRLEFAALDPAIDESLERLPALCDDVVVVEFCELGMLVTLGDKQARDQHAARLNELLDEREERSFEERLARQIRRQHALAHGVEEWRDDAADDGLEQLFLGLEVEIGQALAHFGPCGHVFEPGRRVALCREFLEGRGNDLLRARIPPLPPLFRGLRLAS